MSSSCRHCGSPLEEGAVTCTRCGRTDFRVAWFCTSLGVVAALLGVWSPWWRPLRLLLGIVGCYLLWVGITWLVGGVRGRIQSGVGEECSGHSHGQSSCSAADDVSEDKCAECRGCERVLQMGSAGSKEQHAQGNKG